MTEIKTHSQPITEKDILTFEQKHNVQIPEAYRKFLLQYNGGYPDPNCFDIKKRGGSIMDCFYGLKADSNIRDMEQKSGVFKNRVPDKFIIIGGDQLGNLILIGVEGKYQDKVYFWDHEEESDTDKPIYSNIYPIAKNFDTFFSSLHEYKEKKTNSRPLMDLFEGKDNEKMKKFIESGWDVNTPLENGQRAIERVNFRSNIEILKLLISKGADMKGCLMHAKNNALKDVFELLLESGADPNVADSDGDTLLHDFVLSAGNPVFTPATIERHIEFLKILLKYKVDLSPKNEDGETPIALAKKILSKRNAPYLPGVIDLLISKGAKE